MFEIEYLFTHYYNFYFNHVDFPVNAFGDKGTTASDVCTLSLHLSVSVIAGHPFCFMKAHGSPSLIEFLFL